VVQEPDGGVLVILLKGHWTNSDANTTQLPVMRHSHKTQLMVCLSAAQKAMQGSWQYMRA
jgi:hypothetical protein